MTRSAQTAAARPESECRPMLCQDAEARGGYLVVIGTRTVALVSAETVAKLRAWRGELPSLKADFGGGSI